MLWAGLQTLMSSFLLPQAQAVALTVAQAFTVAFELWQVAKEGRLHSPMTRAHTHTHYQENVFALSHKLLVLTCVCLSEKGRRVKSGSAGEASSSSHSERSDSLGSLKDTGTSLH